MRLIRLCRRIDVTATPEVARPQATRTRVAATRPTRSGNPRRCCGAIPDSSPRSARLPQHVAHPAQSVQQPLLSGVDLAAQVRHIRLDDVDVTPEVVTPDMVEDFRLAQ